ncbi:MAG: hypothetical protein FWH35_02280 [Treponema sp.]|nr:hypothetical protein [Treponema sp.]
MKDFIEQQIITAVRKLLTGKVNELLGEMECPVPLIEFTDCRGKAVVSPDISFSSCEQSEKERIIRLDAYSMSITFTLPETPESELFCYAYSGAVGRAFYDDPTLGGVIDRAVITGKKYVQPKRANCGEGWELIVSLRLTIEAITE